MAIYLPEFQKYVDHDQEWKHVKASSTLQVRSGQNVDCAGMLSAKLYIQAINIYAQHQDSVK